MKNKFVVVHQFDGSVRLLKIDLITGERKIIRHDEVDEKQVTFGMFEVEQLAPELETVALLATPDGPLLVLKDRQFRPDIHKTRIKVKDDGQFSHFLVSDDGEPIFGLFYKEKIGIGLHPYLKDRADFDFYFWLSKNVNNPRLYQVYTKEINYLN